MWPVAVKGGQISALGHPCQEVEAANPRLKLSDNDTLTLHRTKLAWGPNSLRLQWERVKKKKCFICLGQQLHVSIWFNKKCMHIKLGYTDGCQRSEKDFRREIKPCAMLTTGCSGTLVLFVDFILNIENYLYTGLMDKKRLLNISNINLSISLSMSLSFQASALPVVLLVVIAVVLHFLLVLLLDMHLFMSCLNQKHDAMYSNHIQCSTVS